MIEIVILVLCLANTFMLLALTNFLAKTLLKKPVLETKKPEDPNEEPGLMDIYEAGMHTSGRFTYADIPPKPQSKDLVLLKDE